ncbi:MAG: hypothetical protein CMJ41_00010 [Phycisphaerae bacterium]|nr:hypothetical protein [Phycisphaerae bacterium]
MIIFTIHPIFYFSLNIFQVFKLHFDKFILKVKRIYPKHIFRLIMKTQKRAIYFFQYRKFSI